MNLSFPQDGRLVAKSSLCCTALVLWHDKTQYIITNFYTNISKHYWNINSNKSTKWVSKWIASWLHTMEAMEYCGGKSGKTPRYESFLHRNKFIFHCSLWRFSCEYANVCHHWTRNSHKQNGSTFRLDIFTKLKYLWIHIC